MSEDIPIRITSVYTLAEDGQKNRERQNGKTEETNSRSCQNKQWSVVCSLEGERTSKGLYIAPKEMMKLATKHEKNSKDVSSVTVNNTECLSSNTALRPLDNNAASNPLDNTADQGKIYTVFRVMTDTCPSFCCKYNPVLIATLRAKAKALNKAEVKPKADVTKQFF
jgi:hypothetical protein